MDLTTARKDYLVLKMDIENRAGDHPDSVYHARALIAVLVTHRPVPAFDGSRQPIGPICDHCEDGDGSHMTWPCVTYKLIQDNLEW